MTATAAITRDDLESKLREVQTEIETGAEKAKTTALVIAAGAVVAVAGVAFFLGRRKGRRTTTVVEVRRV